ncbi:hypothetical protein ACLMAB_16430 [Brevibacillus laterosporus]
MNRSSISKNTEILMNITAEKEPETATEEHKYMKENDNLLKKQHNTKKAQPRPKESVFSCKVAIVFGLVGNAFVSGFPLDHSLLVKVLP